MAPSQPNKACPLTVDSACAFASQWVWRHRRRHRSHERRYAFPDVWLQAAPFHSYFLPGLILFLAVGGSHFAAAYAIFRRHALAKRAAIFAGIVLTGWMIGELELIGFQAPIQVWFVGVGLLEFGLSFAPCTTLRTTRVYPSGAELPKYDGVAGISLGDSGQRCVSFQEV